MTEQTAYLCIGGPLDGKRKLKQKDQQYFKIASVPSMIELSLEIAPAAVSLDYTTYIADRFISNKGKDEVWFWRPFEQTVTQTFQKLLERYEQAANIHFS